MLQEDICRLVIAKILAHRGSEFVFQSIFIFYHLISVVFMVFVGSSTIGHIFFEKDARASKQSGNDLMLNQIDKTTLTSHVLFAMPMAFLPLKYVRELEVGQLSEISLLAMHESQRDRGPFLPGSFGQQPSITSASSTCSLSINMFTYLACARRKNRQYIASRMSVVPERKNAHRVTRPHVYAGEEGDLIRGNPDSENDWGLNPASQAVKLSSLVLSFDRKSTCSLSSSL